jgi:endonuclease/exonuclease/phosphatase (EEP) superfamily protein YafD
MRRVSWVVCWGAALGVAVWTIVRLFGLEWGFPAIQAMAFTPYVVALALAVAVLSAVLRRWAPAVLALAATLALGGVVVPRALPDDGPTDGAPLRVLSVNLLVGEADPVAIVALVRRTRADLVAFQEFTPDAEARLAAAGLGDLLPNRVLHSAWSVGGSAIYSRLPLQDDGVRKHASGFWQAKGQLTVDGVGAVAVESAHPCAPSDAGRDACWFREVDDQPRPTTDGHRQLLLGDFNATLDHAQMRRVLASGYRDAADMVGAGLIPTWPADKTMPGVTIDHVLVGPDVGVLSFAVHDIPGSDHRAVFAELVLPQHRR